MTSQEPTPPKGAPTANHVPVPQPAIPLPPDVGRESRARIAVYILSFFITLHAALPSYVNSSFASDLVGEERVGMLYIIGAVMSLFLISFLPKILTAIGNFWTTIFLVVLQIGLSLAIAVFGEPLIIIPFLVVALALVRLFAITNDIFLEHHSKDTITGGVRGIYLAVGNAAWIVAAVSAGYVAARGGYPLVYLVAAVALLPTLFVLLKTFRTFKDPIYDKTPMLPALGRIARQPNLWNITITALILHFFFAIMVVYMPIYLHEHMGFGWDTLGIMFSLMLIPYILIEVPAGRIADKKLGEKELLVVGFIIIAIACTLSSALATASFFAWLGVLFMSRVGAALVETMSESFFFKHITASDAPAINIFRSVQIVAYVIAPLFATIFLAFFDFRYLFLAVGVLVLLGIWFSLRLVDTK